MIKIIGRSPAFVVVLALVSAGCSPGARDGVTATQHGLTTTNGLRQNGLTTNGLIDNGMWSNGMWSNGMWSNGMWSNGMWSNGMWSNGMWSNGMWSNGMWSNGMWSNGMWSNGITADAAAPGSVLRSSGYARQLLQYIYSCAMPATTYDTTLDPNETAPLLCASDADCDLGYACSAAHTCVIPLKGGGANGSGLAVNADGTTWWADGTCDESCQRWVSACVLARTNAYGVHVQISMRAPAVVPPGREAQYAKIQAALTTSPLEVATFGGREGAFYGNLFATAPLNPPPSSNYSGPAIGQTVQTPAFYACAGPDSNIPQITKRFCSSQGDQVVIKVPGVCITTGGETGVCDGIDATGSIDGCYTGEGKTGTHYDEVITVYLHHPIAVCGNAVCEGNEGVATDAAYCPSDCHPGGWAHDLDFIGDIRTTGDTPNVTSPFRSGRFPFGDTAVRSMSTVGPDGTVVVIGTTRSTFTIGGLVFNPSDGAGVIVTYDPSGAFKWIAVYGEPYSSGFPYQPVGAAVNPNNGNVSVVGINSAGQMRITTLDAATGDQIGGQTVIATNVDNYGNGAPIGDLAVVPDSQGNVIVGLYATDGYSGVATPFTIGSSTFSCPGGSALNAPCLAVAKIAPQTTSSPQAVVTWADQLPWTGWSIGLAVGPTNNVVASDGGHLHKICADGQATPGATCPDGSQAWLRSSLPEPISGGLVIDGEGNIYSNANTGTVPYAVKYDANGALVWSSQKPTAVAGPADNPGGFWGVGSLNVARDPAGNIVTISFGNTNLGGGIDFGFGTLATYGAYNVFLAAYEPTAGKLRWVKQIPIVGWSLLLGSTIDKQGHAILSGNYTGSMLADSHLLVTDIPETNGSLDGYTLDHRIIHSFVTSFPVPPADETAPQIGLAVDETGVSFDTMPQDIVVPATSPAGATVFYMPPTAIDDGNVGASVICSPRPNTLFIIATTTTVKCTATDLVGNASTATFKVTVVDPAPQFDPATNPAPVEAPDGSGAVVTYQTPVANDQNDGPRPVTCTPASGSLFPIGTTTVMCTATDGSKHQAQTTLQVTVTPPPCAPALGPGSDQTLIGTCSSAALTFTAPAIASSSCQGTTVACAPVPGNSYGDNTVNCTATDAMGRRSAPVAFKVTVLQPLTVRVQSPLTGDNGAVANVVKAGSTVPVKALLYACGTNVTATAPVTATLGVAFKAGGGTSVSSPVVITSNGIGDTDGVMKFDGTHYHYNLSTKGFSVTSGNSSFYLATIKVTYRSAPNLVAGSDAVQLEVK